MKKRYPYRGRYRATINIFSVPLTQMYKIKHLATESAFKNICERMGCFKEHAEFEHSTVIGYYSCNRLLCKISSLLDIPSQICKPPMAFTSAGKLCTRSFLACVLPKTFVRIFICIIKYISVNYTNRKKRQIPNVPVSILT